jgi:DNA-binding FadR family transcriptional regulator
VNASHLTPVEEASTVTRLTSLIAPESVRGRADEIVQRISEAIHLGLLNEGDRLPSEIDLAAQFGVAAMTIRESLAALRDAGLVETRRGRTGGSFIQRPRGATVDQVRRKLSAMTISELRDLTDEHQAIAGQAARLAAERGSPANVRRLFALTEQLGAAATQVDRVRADCRFHVEIAVASQSIRLTRREVELQAELSELLWLPSAGESEVAVATDAHHAIAAAVLAEDAPEARRLAEEHVTANLRRLSQLRLSLADPDGSMEA